MIIKEYGDNSLPKIILLHPMLADGRNMLRLTGGLEGKYCFIAPDLSGQGADKGEFVSAKEEAKTLTAYLKEKKYDTVELIMGASLGGLVGMYMLTDPTITYKTAVLEGTPMYDNARLIYHIMHFGFLKKKRKAEKMPIEKVKEKMKTMYGIFGESMAESFVRMSENSLTAIVRECSNFDFPEYPVELQKRIFLEVGSKDINCKQNKVILTHYPHVHIRVREGYGHCMYMSSHSEEYGKLLESYMNA